MALPEARKTQVQHIQPSPKFQQQAGGIQPSPFPGYSIITPPWVDESENGVFYEQLQVFQQQILQELVPGMLVPVPPASFHMTLADLIWDSAFHHAVTEDANFEQKLRDRLSLLFERFQDTLAGSSPIYWQVLGLIVMPRAVGVCLMPKDEASYEQVVTLRRLIYQDPGLISLGIEQQYHLTAHVTLGYFGNLPNALDRETLSDTLSTLNNRWLEATDPQPLWIHRAELRKFDDMTRYYREPDWATVSF
ncbi:MAG: DUF1868 domain-containing protein [Cyanobacteria bacterium J069]|nr:MAG: DUF1868 domain-containing protein [Cyanobacteria bacterium J069]